MQKHLYTFLLLVFTVSWSQAQPHCKLGWLMQPYFCDMDSLILTGYGFGGAEPYTYLWSTGETSVSILASNLPGSQYSVTVTGITGCTAEGTITLGVNVDPYINGTPVSCENFPVYLDAVFPFLVTPPPGVTFLWSTGQTTSSISTLEPGLYAVTFTDPANGCTFVASQEVTFLSAPEPVITGPAELCGNQSVTLNATGGPFLEYYWIPNGQTTPTLSISAPGTYIVQVQGDNFCYGYDTLVVTSGAGLTVTGTTSPYTSCNDPNGAINISVNPAGSYSYVWSNGAVTQDLNDINAGSYTVTVTSASGCEQSETFVVANQTVTPIPSITTIPSTCGLANGSANLEVNPFGSYIYSWSNGSSNEDLVNVLAGSYQVTVTSTSGCTGTAVAVISDQSVFPIISGNATPNTSCTNPNGSVSISLNPAGTYTYAWSNGASSAQINNLNGGGYQVTVSSSNTCSTTATFVVDNQTSNPVIASTIIGESCGLQDGAIILMVSNSQGPYAYTWSDGSAASSISSVVAGTYTVTVTGADGCQSSSSFVVPVETIPINITGITIPNSSCTASDGRVDIEVSPSGNYAYAWSNGANTQDLNNIGAGSYVVTVTLGNSCMATAIFFVENENIPFTVNGTSINNTSCSISNGSIDLSVDPPAGISFLWSNGETTEDLTNLAGGFYTVSVTNLTGCTISSSFTIANTVEPISISGTPLDNTNCLIPNGAIDISVLPAGAYSYLWTNNSTTEDLTLLSGGVYAITVSDVNGCNSSASFQVTDLVAFPSITAALTNDVCAAGHGAIDLTISPEPNSFMWSTGASTEDLTDLTVGEYQVTVTGASGCSVSDTFNIVNTSNTFSVNAFINDLTSCVTLNGAIDLNISPVGVYTYEWSNGEMTKDVQNLAAGSYTVTVTDVAMCAVSNSYTVEDSIQIIDFEAVVSPSTCGQPNGGIDITLPNSAGVTYQWSNGAVTEDQFNILAGTYSLTVTSSNGCSASGSYMVADTTISFTVQATISNDSSCIRDDGKILLSIVPADLYTFQWADNNMSQDRSNLSAGTYVVTITNSAQCETIDSFSVNSVENLPKINSIVTPSSCGQPNGAIDITIVASPSYTISWSDFSPREDRIGVLAGSYTLTVEDIHGCTAEAVINVPEVNSNFTVSAILQDDVSCTDPSGEIDLNITPAGVYSFLWSNGSIEEDLQDLSGGSYSVTIMDASQCRYENSYTIGSKTDVPAIEANILPASCGNGIGRIDLIVTPEMGNVYLWSTGATTKDLQDLSAGSYAVTVTNSVGCSAEKTFIVFGTVPLQLDLNAILSGTIQNQIVHAVLNVNVPDSALASILWSPSDLADCHEVICMEQNFFTDRSIDIAAIVTDTNGCSDQITLRLEIDVDVKVFIPNVFSPNEDGANDRFTIYTNDQVDEVVELEIFDRWGNKVFSNEHFPPNETSYGWDGIYADKSMNTGVFAYRALLKFSNGAVHPYLGDVTLVR